MFEPTIDRPAGVDNVSTPAQALIGREGLAGFRAHGQQALDAVSQALAGAYRVSSGAGPESLSAALEAIDLDTPCPPGFANALDELGPLYFRHAIYFHHPRYVAHLNCPILSSAAAAEIVAAGVNSSLDTWDQSGAGTLIEQKLIDWTARRAYLPSSADGIFTSGGTQSNLMALLLARERYSAQQWGDGYTRDHGLPPEASRWRIFVSEISHFSLAKAAMVLGLGQNAIVAVSVDETWRMDRHALAKAIEAAIQDGDIPIAIVATFGTTDFGSLDDIDSARRLASTHDLWLHVDAAYGCGLMVSPERAEACRALASADSITVDYHKSFFQPVACSALLVADAAQLESIRYHADYLNPEENHETGPPDQVAKSLQTTRRFDALKLWLSLRTVGVETIGRLFDQSHHLARQTYRLMLAEPRFELLNAPELGALVFRFRPSLAISAERLDYVNDAIRNELAATGEAMIAATRVNGRCYLKFTLMNAQTTLADMAELLNIIIATGQRLSTTYRTSADRSISTAVARPKTTVAHDG